jgi:hypothetical protein
MTNEWISVKDKMPEAGETVLLFVEYGPLKSREIGFLSKEHNDWNLRGMEVPLDSVKFWQYLPELPKEIK